jgi:hypothetical protein
VLVRDRTARARRTCSRHCHVGTQGFSPRSADDRTARSLRRQAARVELRGHGGSRTSSSRSRCGRAREAGAAERARAARGRAAPAEVGDARLHAGPAGVVKGGPAARARVLRPSARPAAPAGRGCRPSTAPRRTTERGPAPRSRPASSDARRSRRGRRRSPELGAALVDGRREAIASPRDAVRGGRGRARAPRREARVRGRGTDHGTTRAPRHARPRAQQRRSGPHLDEIGIWSGDRDLRSFGSQGEQRLAVPLAAPRRGDAHRERRTVPPLLLLDDVLSELDPERRRMLVRRSRGTVRR